MYIHLIGTLFSYIAISILFNVSSDLPPELVILDHRELSIFMVASWAAMVATHKVT